jgi:DNA-binding transcriptional LysR family regulator
VVKITASLLSAITSTVAESEALLLLPHSLATSALAAGRVCILDISRRESIRSMGMLWHQDSELLAVSVFCECMLRHMHDAPLAK